MPNKYITSLPLITALSAGDYIHIDHNNTSNSAQLSSILSFFNKQILANPSSLTINHSNISNNSISTDQISAHSVTKVKLNPDVVNTNNGLSISDSNGIQVELDSTGGLEFNAGKIRIKDSGVTTARISDNSVTNAKLADNSVSTAELSANSVTTEKLADNSVTTAKLADNSVSTAELSANSVTTAKLADNSVTNAKLNSDVVNINSGLEKTTNGIGIKLASGSGLQFEGGSLKIAPKAEVSTTVVVRPNDPNSTDATVTRSTINGELRPCFKTLMAACYYGRTLNGNVTIYVDEDTIEGTQFNGYSVDNCICRYINQVKIDGIFGPNSGLKEGVYVWAKDTSKAITGQLYWNGISNYTKSATTYIRARYNRNGGYSATRTIADPPRNINFNIYISCDKSLVVPTTPDQATIVNFGAVEKWTNFTGLGNSNLQWFYVRSSVLMIDSKMELENLNFVHRFNGPDITITETQNSYVELFNITFSMLGKGFYNYAPLWATNNSEIRFRGNRYLASDIPGSTKNYPGYGIAFVGNKPTNDKDLATKTNNLITADHNGWIRQIDFNPSKVNYSIITTSIILDGSFVNNSLIFMGIYNGGRYQGYPVFIQKDLRFFHDQFKYVNGNLSWLNVDKNLIPFDHNKGCEIQIMNSYNPLRKFTIDGVIDDTQRMAHGFPMYCNGTDFDYGRGIFKNSSHVAANPVDRYVIKTTVNDFEYVTTNYYYNNTILPMNPATDNTNPPDIAFPDIAYIPVSQLPTVDIFYTFVENGATKVINYGAGVRN